MGLVVWFLAPNVAWTLLPLFLLAVCLISMLLMMRSGQCASPPAEVDRSSSAARAADGERSGDVPRSTFGVR